MANLLDNELFKNAVADVMALKEGAEAAALKVIAKKNEKLLKETVNSLLEADDEDKPEDDDEGVDTSSDYSADDKAESSGDAENGSDTSGAATDGVADNDTSSEEAPTDDMPEAPESTEGEDEGGMEGAEGGESGGQTIELDPQKLAQAVGDAVKQAVKQAVISAAGNGESQIDSGDLDGGEGEDGSVDFESPTGEEGEGEGGEFNDGDFDDDDDIMIVPDKEKEGGEGSGEGDDNMFIIQDDGDKDKEEGVSQDYDTTPGQHHTEVDDEAHLHEQLAEAQEEVKNINEFAVNLVEELRNIRLFQQKTEYLKSIFTENFNQFEKVSQPNIVKSIEKAKSTILEKFDNASTLEDAKKVYDTVSNTSKDFASRVKSEMLKLESKTPETKKQPEKKQIAEGAVKGKKNFNLETAKRSVLKEGLVGNKRVVEDSNVRGLLGGAVATRVPTEEETKNFWSDLRKYY